MDKRIAIVEDNENESALLASYFQRYEEEKGCQFQLTSFSCAEVFLDKYRPVFDIVFMDIQLPGINGLEAAARLRRVDKSVMLIFVTNMAQFAIKGYEVRAFDFVVKPVSYPIFSMKLQRMLAELSTREDQMLMIPLANQTLRIAASRIRYIEISGHKIVYHTVDSDITTYGNLRSVEEELNSRTFARCNSCYLVNLKYVQAIQGYTAIVDGVELAISRPKRKAFVQALNDYLGGKFA